MAFQSSSSRAAAAAALVSTYLSGFGVRGEEAINYSNSATIQNACEFGTDSTGNALGGTTTKIVESAYNLFDRDSDFRTGNAPAESVSIPHLNKDASEYIIPLQSTIAAALERSRGAGNTRDDIFIRGNAKVLDVSSLSSDYNTEVVDWHTVTDHEIASMISNADPISLTMSVASVDSLQLEETDETKCSEFYNAVLDMSEVYDLDQTYTAADMEKLFALTNNDYVKPANEKITNYDEKYFAILFEFETVLNSLDGTATAASLTDVVARKQILVSIPTQPSTDYGIATGEVHDDNFGVDGGDQFSLAQISAVELQSETSVGGDVKAAGVASDTFKFQLTANLNSTDPISPNAQFPIQFSASLQTDSEQTFATDQFHYVEAHYLRQTWIHKELEYDLVSGAYIESAPVSKVHYYYVRPEAYDTYEPGVLNACPSTDPTLLLESNDGCCKVNTWTTSYTTGSTEKYGSGIFAYDSAGSSGSFTPTKCEVESQFMITDFTYKPEADPSDRVFPTAKYGTLGGDATAIAATIYRDWRAEVLFPDAFRQSLIEERRIQWWNAVSAGNTAPSENPKLATTFELVTTASVMYEDGQTAGTPIPESQSGNFSEDAATRRRQDEPVKYVTSEVSVEVAQSYSVSVTPGPRPSEFARIAPGDSQAGSSSDADRHVAMSLAALVLVSLPLVLVA